jgi:hypothetical protein
MPATRKQSNKALAPSDGWVSVVKAANILGKAPATIYAMALRGEIRSQVVGGRVFLSFESIQAIKASAA